MSDEMINNLIYKSFSSLREWKDTPSLTKSKILLKFEENLLKHKHDLASTITQEMGKPIKQALSEVDYAASYLRYYAYHSYLIYGDIIQDQCDSITKFIIKEPLGLVALFTPWNFPLAMLMKKLPAALAASCCILHKPSELTPLTAFKIKEIAVESGLPEHVYQVISCSADRNDSVGKSLCLDPKIHGISFTGSTNVGKIMYNQCSSTVKRLSMELGGNAPFIVFNSADLKLAANHLIVAKTRNSGQTCISPNRIFIEETIWNEFILLLLESIKNIQYGDPVNELTDMGPLINQKAIDKVQNHIKDAIAKGGSLIYGGYYERNLHQPTVVVNCPINCLNHFEETFGPTIFLTKFSGEQQVIEFANNSHYGLAAYIYSNDYRQIRRCYQTIKCGMVGVNTHNISSELTPFGGIKQSGFGREGSKYGLDEFMTHKYIHIS